MLEDLGNIGDFIGGIAVIITLIYLALQVRQNTISVEAATLLSASKSFAESMDNFMREPELIKIYLEGCQDFEALNTMDRQRYASIMGSMLHRFEGLVALHERGLLPKQTMEGALYRLNGAFKLPGTQNWWRKGKFSFNPQLRDWVQQEFIRS